MVLKFAKIRNYCRNFVNGFGCNHVVRLLSVFVFILVGLAAGVLFILLGTILGPKRHYAEKTRLTNAVSKPLEMRG